MKVIAFRVESDVFERFEVELKLRAQAAGMEQQPSILARMCFEDGLQRLERKRK